MHLEREATLSLVRWSSTVTLDMLSMTLLTLLLTHVLQNPTNDGTQQLTVKLPDGIKCAGGSDKNRCLASFVTTAGYGNCVVVKQAGTSENTSPTDGGNAQPNTNGGKSVQTGASQVNEGEKPKNKKRMTMRRRH